MVSPFSLTHLYIFLANAGWLLRQSKQTKKKLIEKRRVCMADVILSRKINYKDSKDEIFRRARTRL